MDPLPHATRYVCPHCGAPVAPGIDIDCPSCRQTIDNRALAHTGTSHAHRAPAVPGTPAFEREAERAAAEEARVHQLIANARERLAAG